ncbi:2Fe-2S iron-sulfur cluster-binding protein [Kiloniella sp.]|uniref:2Fe-2S iron-sulfur cluster-binding protein n=1 Tax=Kiloniella sp. TaxID=1938587 RepID=UPI003B01669D
MSSRLESPWGSRINRSEKIQFSFEGKAYEANEGDCIASALAANGQWVLSRSFKYHRPRGVLTMAGQDANTLVQLKGEPNVRADIRPVRNGMTVTAQNVHGSLKNDKGAILDRFGRFMPVGFYYRSFFQPGMKSWLKFWEPIIRNFAGLGKVSFDAETPKYNKVNLHCDVMVIGAGPAGLSAALSAANAGADIILIDNNPETGGALTYARFDSEGVCAQDTLQNLRRLTDDCDNLKIISNATCNGWFADNWLPVLQGEILYRVRTKEVVVATGVHEQPLIFRNNDLPGILLSSAVQRLMRHYAVCPGTRAVIFAGNRDGYLAALDLLEAGVLVEAILDPHVQGGDTDFSDNYSLQGTRVLHGVKIEEALGMAGNSHVKALRVTHSDNSSETLPCDLVVIATGYTPGYQLPLHAGAKLSHNDATKEFYLTNLPKHMHIAGSAMGYFDLKTVLRSGEIAGVRAALAAGFSATMPESLNDNTASQMNYFSTLIANPNGRDFVDFDEDLQVKDIKNAIADGYSELELIKRYSTVGMGPSQGRHSALPTARIVASETDRSVAQVGITTSRPPFGPEKLGLLAGPHHVPYRHTAIHKQHVTSGAKMTPVGAWWRPLYYGVFSDNNLGRLRQPPWPVDLIIKKGVPV